MNKTKFCAAAAAVIFVGSVLWCAAVIFRDHGETAEIIQDGRTLYTLDLSKETDRTITIDNEYGRNVIEIKDGKIRMLEADCPDKICVDTGWLGGSVPIVCLPNKLIIRFSGGDGKTDAATG